MSIDYRVSEDGFRIETFPMGVLNIKDTIEYFGKLKNDKRIKQGAVESYASGTPQISGFPIWKAKRSPDVIKNPKNSG
jgi:hypothetical protein